MRWAFALAALTALLLVPQDAYAWSLVTHMAIGRSVLESFRDLLAVHAPTILQFPLVYLYGSVAPDRFLAKNLKGYREHTHNWDRAFFMLRHAGTDDLKAFAYGYLSHLAADVIAHNLFVPMKIMERPGMAGRRHAYWEVKFEHYQPREAWDLAERVDRQVDKALFDSFMEMFQSPSLLSFGANMRITDRVFKVMGAPGTRRMVSRFERRSDSALTREEAELYMELARDCVLGVVRDLEQAHCTAADPRGGSRIAHARMLSKAVSRVARGEADAPERVRKAFGNDMAQLLDDAAAVLPDSPSVGTGSAAYRSLKESANTPLPRPRGRRSRKKS